MHPSDHVQNFDITPRVVDDDEEGEELVELETSTITLTDQHPPNPTEPARIRFVIRVSVMRPIPMLHYMCC